MIPYLDTSALLKLYVSEPESDAVRQWAGAATLPATSRLALVEALSGLARRHRDQALTVDEVQAVAAAVQAEWDDYLTVEIDEVTAARLVLRHPLRALAAIHLAAALDLAATAPQFAGTAAAADVRLASFDARQRAAAVAEGLEVLPSDSRE